MKSSQSNDGQDYQGAATPNRDILLAKKKAPSGPKKVVEIQPVLSKSVLRKMAKLTREKESKKHRLHSLEILQEHQFDGDKRVLFQQSGTIGTDRTKAEELARLYGLKQAGVELGEEETAALKEALVDFGDLDSSTAYAEKKKQSMSCHAFKTATANPFMPLSTASATINATIQDRLVGTGRGGQKKVYSQKELQSISENMTVNEFDVQYTKKLKKRQRREEHALINQKLQELNSRKVHELAKDMQNGVDLMKPEQLIVLPKELRGMASILTEQAGGKVRVVTSNVSGGQLHKPKQDGTNLTPSAHPDESNDGFKAAAHLISKGLLTTKSKDKLDALFTMDAFSDSGSDSDSDNDQDDGGVKRKLSNDDEDLWGVAPKQEKKKQEPATAKNKKLLKKQTQGAIEDEFVSASAAAQLSRQGPSLPTAVTANDMTDASTQDGLKASLPASLAMPTITRTNKAAVVSKTLPVAVLAGSFGQGDQPAVTITKRQKGNKPIVATQSEMHPDQLVQLQEKEAEYSVKFQVLKSRQVRNFLQSIHDGTNADMSDAEDENTYTQSMSSTADIYGSHQPQPQQEPEQPRKRRVLFDFTQPVTADTSQLVRSTLVIDDSTLIGKDRSIPVPASAPAASQAQLNAAKAAGPKTKAEKEEIAIKKQQQKQQRQQQEQKQKQEQDKESEDSTATTADMSDGPTVVATKEVQPTPAAQKTTKTKPTAVLDKKTKTPINPNALKKSSKK